MPKRSAQNISQYLANETQLSFLFDLQRTHKDTKVYLIGGMVRNILLGRRSITDYDIVVSGLDRDTLEQWLRDHGDVRVVGRRFGVLKFIPTDTETKGSTVSIDIALPRTESPTEESLGGYRDFEISTDPDMPIERDLERRDFTINAMAYEIREGVLVDPFDGQEDLATQQIRAVGTPDQRFKEDLSRMLRAVRFAVTLDFHIEPETLAAVRSRADQINRRDKTDRFVVPREVIGSELAKALRANPQHTLKLLYKTGLAQELAPKLTQRIMRNPLRLRRVHKNMSLTALVAILLALLPSDDRRTFLRETGLDTLPKTGTLACDKKTALWIAKQLDEGSEHPDTSEPADFEKRWMNERGNIYKDVLRSLGKGRVVQAVDERERIIRDRTGVPEDTPIVPLVDGDDVLEYIAPGPRVGAILKRVRNAQLRGEIASKEDALALLKEILK